MTDRRFTAEDPPRTTVDDLADYAAGLRPWTIDSTVPALLVVAPHPDDEVLGAGSLIGTAVRVRVPVIVLAVTDGTRSHAHVAPALLGRIRTAESETALAALAETAAGDAVPTPRTVRLGLPDGEVPAYEDVLVERIVEQLAQLPPGTVVTAPVRGDGHPDHDAAGRAALRAIGRVPTASLVEYPVWLWHHCSPGAPQPDVDWCRARVVAAVPEVVEARARAVEAFRSQISLDLGVPADRVGEASETCVVVPEAARSLMLVPDQIVLVHTGGFEAVYADSDDPWSVTHRWYEERKYALTLAILPARRFRRGFEPGCSVGVLTEMLAQRCDELVATDVVPGALETARGRVPDPHVDLRCAGADDWPEGTFDLVVLSELGYYLTDAAFAVFLERAAQQLTDNGVVVAAHWRHPIPGAYRDARAVHSALAAQPGWVRLAAYRDDDVLIETFGVERTSVAAGEFAVTPGGSSEHPGSSH